MAGCSECKLATSVPEIPQYAPYTLRDLSSSKTYLWCSCGRSKKQPWCDDSHLTMRGADGVLLFKPIPLKPSVCRNETNHWMTLLTRSLAPDVAIDLWLQIHKRPAILRRHALSNAVCPQGPTLRMPKRRRCFVELVVASFKADQNSLAKQETV